MVAPRHEVSDAGLLELESRQLAGRGQMAGGNVCHVNAVLENQSLITHAESLTHF
jgi:hypothetical protein